MKRREGWRPVDVVARERYLYEHGKTVDERNEFILLIYGGLQKAVAKMIDSEDVLQEALCVAIEMYEANRQIDLALWRFSLHSRILRIAEYENRHHVYSSKERASKWAGFDEIDNADAISVGFASLKPKELDILRSYFGLGCDKETLVEMGGGYSVTRERVRQIKERAVFKMRKAITKTRMLGNV